MKYFLILIVFLFSLQSLAQEKKKKGFSTLPGWSGGYRYYLDLDEDEKSKLRNAKLLEGIISLLF